MRWTRTLESCCTFANFAIEQGLLPYDLAELILLARRAFSAGERAASVDDEVASRREDKTGEAFAEKAQSLGYTVIWPGLWPTLVKDGKQIHLPSID